jgi:hypothetical protein
MRKLPGATEADTVRVNASGCGILLAEKKEMICIAQMKEMAIARANLALSWVVLSRAY